MAIRVIPHSLWGTMVMAFLLLTGTPPGASQSSANDDNAATDLARRAEDAQRRHDYSSAAEIYEKLVRLEPESPEIQANLGLMYFLTGQYERAKRQFAAALRHNPDLFVPNLFLGLTLLKFGKPGDALLYLLAAQRLNPGDENALQGAGRAYEELGQDELAIDSYRRALEISPRNSDALFGLGTTYLELERSAAERIAKVGKESFYAQMLLAESFLNQGRAPDSIRIYKQLLAANPHRPGLHTSIGFAYLNRSEVSTARSEFQAEIGLFPHFLAAHLGLARVALEDQNSAQGLSELQTIWKTDPGFMRTSLSFLWLSADPGAERKLKERFRMCAEAAPDVDLRKLLLDATSPSNPSLLPRPWPNYPDAERFGGADQPSVAISPEHRDDPQILFSLGNYSACAQNLEVTNTRLPPGSLLLMAQCKYLSGKFEGAFSTSEKILHADPGNVPALYWKAESAEQLALDALGKAGLADPDSHRAHLVMAQTHRAAQNYQAAEREYLAVLQVKPSDNGARLGLATTYWKELKFDQALTELQVVLRAYPEDTQASYIIGDILVTRHQYSEARSHLLIAVRGDDESALRAHASLSKVYAAQGDVQSAIKELEIGLPADSDGSLHYQLSRLYDRAGDRQKAALALEQSQALRERQTERARRGVKITP